MMAHVEDLISSFEWPSIHAVTPGMDAMDDSFQVYRRLAPGDGQVSALGDTETVTPRGLERLAAKATLVVWRTSELPESIAESVARLIEVSALHAVFFPASSGATITSVEGELLPGPFLEKNDPERLYALFLRLLEHTVRLELKHLAQINQLLQGTRCPWRDLFRKVADYRQTDSNWQFLFPPIPRGALPSNVLGERGMIQAGTSVSPAVKRVFEKDGLLHSKFPAYEERPQQADLAQAIHEALESGLFVLAEAGTGTGKSLSYLVPAILHSLEDPAMEENVVVSTHTKNLQDQLFFKDLPLLRYVFPFTFKAALLKGRGNYLCMKKWKSLMADPLSLMTPSERERVLPVFFWQLQTSTGDISECTAFPLEQNMNVWTRLASEAGYCQAHKCQASADCYVKRIRDEARKANIVVINHALLFSDLVSENAILGSYRHLVIDEAHHIERVAQNYLGMEFSLWAVRSVVVSLYERDQMETGLLIQLRQQLARASLSALEKRSFEKKLEETTEACAVVWSKTTEYLRELTTMAFRQADSLKRPDGNGFSTSMRVRYGRSNNLLAADVQKKTDFFEALDRLDVTLARLINELLGWKPGAMDQADEHRETLEYREKDVQSLRETIEFLSDPSQADYVFWYELPSRERSADIRFYAAPLNIADILKTSLFDRLHACVFSSATLSIAGDFDYFKERSGIQRMESRRVHEFSVGSPFDFDRQCRVLVPSFLPDPTRPDYNDRCAETIRDAILHTRRGTLVLFTSYAMMNHCHRALKATFEREGIPLLVQGRDGSRTHLTHRFREQAESVLFGTDSFWEGVDVQGDSLEMLIITKLPFEVPTDPVVAAKSERIERRGGQPFMEYSVPEAVIKLRQGFGRLIRSKTDRGVAIILDNRVVSKRYGSLFLQSLPARAETVPLPEDLLDRLDSFFKPEA